MGWKLFASTDASAPVLTGQAGSLITLLDAILVNGYGSKAAAGWTKAFSGTNKAAYRMGSGRMQAYLRVLDNAPVSAAEAQITAYEAMTAVDTGTNPFPSYLVLRKSLTADATARPWYCVADDRTFVLMAHFDSGANASMTYLGEFHSYVPNDNFGVCFIGRHWENSTVWTSGVENAGTLVNGAWAGGTPGHYLCRDEIGLTKGPLFEVFSGLGIVNSLFAGSLGFPNPADGSLVLTPLYVRGTTNIMRGRLRGLWAHAHAAGSLPWSHGDTVSGTGDLAGKTFLHAGNLGAGGGTGGVCFLETSDTVARN